MSDQFSPAFLLNSCQPLSFKSHIYSQMAFILQGKENPGSAILSNLLKVTDKDCGKTGVLTQTFLAQDSHTLALAAWFASSKRSGWAARCGF